MGNASVKAHRHGHRHTKHYTKHYNRRHNKRFNRRTRHRYNRGGGLNPDKSGTRKIYHSKPGFHKSPSLERSVVLGEARKAEAESKRLQSLKKVNAEEGSKVFSKRASKKPVAKMAAFQEEDEE
jgi:hypothetical protein